MIKKTLTVEKEVFQARDGMEFETETECAKYEVLLENEKRYEAACDRIDSIEIPYDKKTVPPLIPLRMFVMLDGDMSRIKRKIRQLTVGKSWNSYKLSGREDVSALAEVMAYESGQTPQEIIRKLGKVEFPCTGLYSSDHKHGREIGTLKKELDLVRKYCRLHGYDVTLKKRVAAEGSTLQEE